STLHVVRERCLLPLVRSRGQHLAPARHLEPAVAIATVVRDQVSVVTLLVRIGDAGAAHAVRRQALVVEARAVRGRVAVVTAIAVGSAAALIAADARPQPVRTREARGLRRAQRAVLA